MGSDDGRPGVAKPVSGINATPKDFVKPDLISG
jgi:hypothetical protein